MLLKKWKEILQYNMDGEGEDMIYAVFKYLDGYGLGMSIGITPKEAIRLFILIYENTYPNKLIDL